MRRPQHRTVLIAIVFGAAVAAAYGLKLYAGLIPTGIMPQRLQWGLPVAGVATGSSWILVREVWPAPDAAGWGRRLLRDIALLFACALVSATALFSYTGPVF